LSALARYAVLYAAILPDTPRRTVLPFNIGIPLSEFTGTDLYKCEHPASASGLLRFGFIILHESGKINFCGLNLPVFHAYYPKKYKV
jgi:hypothetical protein